MSFEDWFRHDRLPHIFCAGCGNGSIINCALTAIDSLGWEKDNTVFVSGIGCSSRAPGYITADSLHTTHGRALAFATGVKMAKQDFNVVVFTGDGDLSAIGGNHFIHSARRNIDMTVICMNNQIYGMTGGQGSPCTPSGALSTTTPYGMDENPFDLCELAAAAGANFVARWTSYHVKELTRSITLGLQKPGFSFIEVFVQCPTNFGRRNKLRDVESMISVMRDHALIKEKYDRLVAEGKPIPPDMFVVGNLTNRNLPALGVKK
ncbi:MAG: 2-oxoacid:ferredoxin oxidoreductase subunit beta [Methanocalculus sp. MSAO_Arc1]|uniref:thiamine pyrophosphate-dependent enzyme n=1 Tax=Methanocalculus TaxID=71151 RepID=UPI000FF05A08|nr:MULTISPECIES: thiamine pyrophosphate-dependent enzyme [unclassified Methanocalculus]MCP1663207.1 2-oxoglutarate ferredoxin oxidoreductase subunit beta [Methanocalculus sp. AMF5]RQD80708.1 MAG: 2-oxoacid:ferredoxin oxidoreductase subunit beta [Methanocalculus sp. MSAO_Arc1]